MFELPPLPYDYNALEPYVDEETMHVHHDGHHAAYVKNLNDALEGHEDLLNMDVEELLRSLDKVPEEIRTKIKNNAGGHYHHSLFWTIMKSGGSEPSGKILETINQTFEDFNTFKTKFNDSGKNLFGSGWTWLVWDQGKLSIINTPNQDSPVSNGQFIILGNDLWEHAYYLKYKNKRADYLEAWWNVVNWNEVDKRFQLR